MDAKLKKGKNYFKSLVAKPRLKNMLRANSLGNIEPFSGLLGVGNSIGGGSSKGKLSDARHLIENNESSAVSPVKDLNNMSDDEMDLDAELLDN